MTAAGTFFQSTFGMDPIWGLIIVGAITLIYTFFGGFLGASWTDTVQGLLMLAALVTVPIMAVFAMGGWSEVANQLHLVDAANAAAGDATNHLSFFGAGTTTAMVLGIISSLAWGLGYFGQPHIIVRFMALRSAKDAVNGRRIGISWMIVISLGAVLAGLIGAAYFNKNGMPLDNQETVFLALAQELFPPLLAGFVLAAVLAAIMSTLSSQLVVSSSALVEDLMGSRNKKLEKSSELIVSRMGVLIIAVVGAILSFTMQKLVMAMVAFAWAGFGASFGPTVILSLYWKKLTRTGALAGMVAGAVTVLIWGNVPSLSGTLYEIVPGFLLNLIVAVVVSQFTKPVSAAALTAFDEAVAASKSGASVAPDADPEEKVLVNN
jgi:sodium/proline symporter